MAEIASIDQTGGTKSAGLRSTRGLLRHEILVGSLVENPVQEAAMSNEEIARAYYEAVNQKDFNALGAHASANMKFVDVAQGKTTTGKDALKKDAEYWLGGFPDGKIQILNVISGGDYVVVEYVGRGTHTAPLGSGAEAIPATNKKIELAYCDVLRFQNGELIALTSYYDSATAMRQLGIAPRPRAEAEARPEVRPS